MTCEPALPEFENLPGVSLVEGPVIEEDMDEACADEDTRNEGEEGVIGDREGGFVGLCEGGVFFSEEGGKEVFEKEVGDEEAEGKEEAIPADRESQ